MSNVQVEGKSYTLQEAFNILTNTCNLLQTSNGQLQGELATTKQQLSTLSQRAQKNYTAINNIALYDGKTDITLLYVKIELAARIGGLDDADKYLALQQKLDDRVLRHCMSDPTCIAAKNYKDLKAALSERYKHKNSARFYREQLANIKMQDSENLEEFSDRIKILNGCTFDLTDDATKNQILLSEADQRALDAFLNALSGNVAEQTRLSNPATLDAAVRTAITVQEVFRRTTPQNNESHMEQKSLLVMQHSARCAKCNKRNHPTEACRAGAQGCFKCGSLLHIAAYCREASGYYGPPHAPAQGQHYRAPQAQHARGSYRAQGVQYRPPFKYEQARHPSMQYGYQQSYQPRFQPRGHNAYGARVFSPRGYGQRGAGQYRGGAQQAAPPPPMQQQFMQAMPPQYMMVPAAYPQQYAQGPPMQAGPGDNPNARGAPQAPGPSSQ